MKLAKTIIIGIVLFGIPIFLSIMFKVILNAILPLAIFGIALVTFIVWYNKRNR